MVGGQQQGEILHHAGGIPSGSNPVPVAICITLSLIICQGESQLAWHHPTKIRKQAVKGAKYFEVRVAHGEDRGVIDPVDRNNHLGHVGALRQNQVLRRYHW